MDAFWKSTLDAYMGPLYNGNPEGKLLKSIQSFEKRFEALAEQHPGETNIADLLNQSGLQDEYNQLYFAVMNGNHDYALPEGEDQPQAFDYAKEQRLPTVHEFLDTYRVVYEAVRPNNSEATNKAYEALFEVENRTDDLITAQMIIEKEHLIVHTVTAAYEDSIKDFMEAADPNYEIISAGVNATLGSYVKAKSLDEITYRGEIARATTVDVGVQAQAKVSMMLNFTALIFGWENCKRKIRQKDGVIEALAQAMVLTRKKMREYYRFMSEDMGLSFEVMEKTPFYRIMMLMPTNLDAMCRVKKVMHPDNIQAIKYVLFEEILSDKTMEEILLTPQKAPYYENIDTILYPTLDDEFMEAAKELNRDIPYFQRNERAEMMEGKSASAPKKNKQQDSAASAKEYIQKMEKMNGMVATAPGNLPGGGGGIAGGAVSAVSGATGIGSAAGVVKSVASMGKAMKSQSSEEKKEMAKEMAKDMAKSAVSETVSEIGRGLLRGLFRR